MSPDIREALGDAAARPRRPFDAAGVLLRAEELKRNRRTTAFVAAGLAVLAVVGVGAVRELRPRPVGLTGSYYPGTRTQVAKDGWLVAPARGQVEPALLDNGERVFVTTAADGAITVLRATHWETFLEHEVAWCPEERIFQNLLNGKSWDERGFYRYPGGTGMTWYGIAERQGNRVRVDPSALSNSPEQAVAPTQVGACRGAVAPDLPVPAAPAGTRSQIGAGWVTFDGVVVLQENRLLLCGARDSKAFVASAQLTGCVDPRFVANVFLPAPLSEFPLRGRFVAAGERLVALPDVTTVANMATELFGYVLDFPGGAGPLAVRVDKADWYSGADAVREAGKDGKPVDNSGSQPVYVRNVNPQARDFAFRDDADIWLTSTSRVGTGRRMTPAQLREAWNRGGDVRSVGFWFALDAQDRIIWAVEQYQP